MIKKEYKKICKRFDGVMWDIGCEYLALSDGKSEIFSDRRYYNVEKGVTLQWMHDEASYWLSCYYEPGHCRCDDKMTEKRDIRFGFLKLGS